MDYIGNNIRILREQNNLTQDQLGDKLGISGKTISSWEKNRSEPKMGMIEKMSVIFGCNKSDIIDKRIIPFIEHHKSEMDKLFERIQNLDDEQKKLMFEYVEFLEIKNKNKEE